MTFHCNRPVPPLAVLFVLLQACSGGGSGSDPMPTVPTNNPPTTAVPDDVCTGSGTQPTVSSQLQWPHYAADQSSSRFAPTTMLTRDNFADLSVVWRWCSPDDSINGFTPNKHESTPIMIDGVLFNSTSLSQAVAINAITGESIWVFDPASYIAGVPPNLGFVNRGVAYWADDSNKHVFLATGDSRLIALNATTGVPVPTFADSGTVDLTRGLGRTVSNQHYGISSAPLVCGTTVVVGASILDYPSVVAMPPGDVRGFNVLTGQLKWQFRSIPQSGEAGNETWENESYRDTGGTNVWTTMSCDAERGIVYLPFGTPTNDYYGGDRLGDNLFGESLVAVDAETGARVWHYQIVHHGIWDYDLPAAPNLMDVVLDGEDEPRALVAQVTKHGFTFVFDRASGVPIWPISELTVTASTVPGERAALTQPFPTKPPPFERQGTGDENVIDFSPSLRQTALDHLAQFDVGPLFTPPTERGTLILPGIGGGASWSGAGYHPARQLLYIPSFSLPFVIRIEDQGQTTTRFVGNPDVILTADNGVPLFQPPYGRITAIDMASGEHAWMTPVGRGYEALPQLADMNLGTLGMPRRIFVAVTENLLLASQEGSAGSQEALLRAYDLDTGELIGSVPLPGHPMGTLSVYEVNDQVFVVLPIGRSDSRSELVALSLST